MIDRAFVCLASGASRAGLTTRSGGLRSLDSSDTSIPADSSPALHSSSPSSTTARLTHAGERSADRRDEGSPDQLVVERMEGARHVLRREPVEHEPAPV